MKKQTKTKQLVLDMTEGPITKKIVIFAIPLLISTLLQQFYTLADTMVVSYNLGETAIAAIGATATLYTLLIYIAYGMNNGFSLSISQAFGAKDLSRVRKTVGTMIILDIIIAILLTVLALTCIKPMMHWMNTPADIFDQAYIYIIIVLGGLATTILYNMFAAFLRAVGNSRTPLILLVFSCCINLALNVLFIVGLHTDVGGAAVATVLSEGISGVTCLIYVVRHYPEYLPRKADFRLEKHLTWDMLTMGLSVAMMLSVFQIGSIILQRSINELGTVIITAYTTGRRIFDLLMLPLNTISSAVGTFVGQNFGAGNYKRVKAGMRQTIFLCIGWSAISAIVAFPFSGMLCQLVANTTNPTIIENASMYVRVGTAFFVPLGIVFVIRLSMQSMGHKVAPVISTTIELAVKVLISVFVVSRLGFVSVAWTEPITWIMMMCFLLIIYFVRIHKTLEEKTA